jgi:hypothetical protein
MATCREAGGIPHDRVRQTPQATRSDPNIPVVSWDDQSRQCWMVLSNGLVLLERPGLGSFASSVEKVGSGNG